MTYQEEMRWNDQTQSWTHEEKPAQHRSRRQAARDHNYNAGYQGQEGRLHQFDSQPGKKNNSSSSRPTRGSFPWINSQIIQASEQGDFRRVVTVIEPLLPQMNLVNLSTALHRLAKLSTSDPNYHCLDARAKNTIRELKDLISVALSQLAPHEAQSQSLNNVAWSLATMRITDRPLVQVVCALTVSSMSSFKPFELSTTLWSLTKLGNVDDLGWITKPVFQTAATHIMRNVDYFGFRCLATTVWAFATAKQRHARLFRCVGTRLLRMADTANCQEMANTVWAFATADFHNDELFTELARAALKKLDQFKPQELSNMFWGFASNSFFHEAFFYQAANLLSHMDLQSQHLANILWAFARLRPRHPLTQDTVVALMPACTRQLHSFKPQEVSSTVLTVAKAFAPCVVDGGDDDPALLVDERLTLEDPDLVELPVPVLHFCKAVVPWAVPRVHDFSVQSIANMGIAFVMLRRSIVGNECQVMLNVLANVIISRCSSSELDPTSMWRLFKAFAAGPPEENSVAVIKALSVGLVSRLTEMRHQELQTLERAITAMACSTYHMKEVDRLGRVVSQVLNRADHKDYVHPTGSNYEQRDDLPEIETTALQGGVHGVAFTGRAYDNWSWQQHQHRALHECGQYRQRHGEAAMYGCSQLGVAAWGQENNIEHEKYDIGYTKHVGMEQLPELGNKFATSAQAHTPYVDLQMAQRTGHPEFSPFHWRLSVKNSFLHFERTDKQSTGLSFKPVEETTPHSMSDYDDDPGTILLNVTDSGSSHRSSSAPSHMGRNQRNDVWNLMVLSGRDKATNGRIKDMLKATPREDTAPDWQRQKTWA